MSDPLWDGDRINGLLAERDELLALVRFYADMGHYSAKQYIAKLNKGAYG